jgi:hypothetical protein
VVRFDFGFRLTWVVVLYSRLELDRRLSGPSEDAFVSIDSSGWGAVNAG